MMEEPYRWVEAVAQRREYIENELSAGSPIAALCCAEGILLLTVSRERRKLFEIYDRIAMGAIGHPGDIERLRLNAIELASAEGFARSVEDVSLRRLCAHSLSPLLKTAFEQIYGPPCLARMLFAELGRPGEADTLFTLDYDGSFHANGGLLSRENEPFAVISGTRASALKMEAYLRRQNFREATFAQAAPIARNAWALGRFPISQEWQESQEESATGDAFPSPEAISKRLEEELRHASVEAVVLERHSPGNVAFAPYLQ